MDAAKRQRLAEAGFHSTTVSDFLGLSVEQSELIEIKVALTRALKEGRNNSHLSQSDLAAQIGSSQSRVAKMEAGDPHVSLDLLIKALLACGTTRRQIADCLAGDRSRPSEGSVERVRVTDTTNTRDHYKFTTRVKPSKIETGPKGKQVLGV